MENYTFSNHINQPQDKFTKTISILIVIVLVYLILYVVTFAWFGESKLAVSPPLIIGEISLVVDFDYDNLILEPNKIYENTNTTIKTKEVEENEGIDAYGIDAYIKIKIETDQTVTTPDNQNEFLLHPTFAENNNWMQGTNNWWYFVGHINNMDSASFNLQATRHLTRNEIGKEINISLTVHAIQKDFLLEQDLTNQDSDLFEWVQDAPQEFISFIEFSS